MELLDGKKKGESGKEDIEQRGKHWQAEIKAEALK